MCGKIVITSTYWSWKVDRTFWEVYRVKLISGRKKGFFGHKTEDISSEG